ncbi:ATP-binding protein [Aquabacterium sp. A7-Y]|uniref:sensor histidine kinase n=1 Tax=Aquabacterium sp. A7-Y TaxID=1349605 RepID=UPI00223D0239|nr:ATP-binding protein [Aquabacterium sp. A7-Y]MCW7538554.1 ATP-binding protein [Aquabacterium sp. A7-Y]
MQQRHLWASFEARFSMGSVFLAHPFLPHADYRAYVAAGMLVAVQVALITGFFLERTGRRRAQREARHVRAHLVHLARVSSMGELVVSLAHELNQPLTAVHGNARTAARMLSRDQVPVAELADILQDIVNDVKRAADLVAQIRDMVSRRPAERVHVDVNGAVRNVRKLLAGESAVRRVPVELDLTPLPLRVEADPIQLQQVLLNLVLNAIEAASMSRGDPPKVEIRSALSAPRTVHIVVRDNGPGLEPGMEGQVFEPFYTTKGSGMGIGLWIARSIVESHGGRIWATNVPEGGAAFHVALPRVPGEEEA